MYKFFLCLHYLRRRHIALVAIVGMALCVFMVLVVVSVMNGFLNHVALAARGMMGDVIVDCPMGMAHYDAFITEMKDIPQVRAATPVIYSHGLLRISSNYTQTVRVVGVRLPEATAVSEFADGLHPQELKRRPAFRIAPGRQEQLDHRRRDRLQRLEADIDVWRQRLAGEEHLGEPLRDTQLIAELRTAIEAAERSVKALRRLYTFDEKLPGIILGVDLPGTTERDEKTGAYTRRLPTGMRVQLTLLPIGRTGISTMTQPIKKSFTFVGDSRMGIYQIDSAYVYVDFDVLQELIDMAPVEDVDTGRVAPGRCTQIQIKVEGPDDEADLLAAARKVRNLWAGFKDRHPDLGGVSADIQTWRQKQAQYVGPIEKQRDLTTIMFCIVSMVAVVLVFAIFYMMVVQKTKDIGVLKSIGASSGGVAGLYLLYGGAVGLVSSVIGAVGGYCFVRQINPIHDWIAEAFGWRVFDRRAYLFDRIPNDVSPWVVFAVVVGAIVAGLVGALLPAIRAARMQPVEALRYE